MGDLSKGLQGVIADGVAEGMQTAHLNKTPSEVENEKKNPEFMGSMPKSLLDYDHE